MRGIPGMCSPVVVLGQILSEKSASSRSSGRQHQALVRVMLEKETKIRAPGNVVQRCLMREPQSLVAAAVQQAR